MTTTIQILSGSLVLGLCSLVHITFLVGATRALGRLAERYAGMGIGLRWGVLIATAFTVIVLSHTVQVWTWSAMFVWLGALRDFADAIYFALVTYTTLGYGDVTVGRGYGVFAAMAAVTGLLNFGLSTAFLVGLFTRLLAESGILRPNP